MNRQVAGAWLAVALFVAATVWLLVGAVHRVTHPAPAFTPQTVAPPVIYQEEP